MLITTTNSLDGHEVVEYLGVVSAETVVGVNVFKDFFAGMRDFFGGRSGSYEKTIKDCKDMVFSEMSAEAEKYGANALIGVDIGYEILGKANGMLMVSGVGTAVKIKKT